MLKVIFVIHCKRVDKEFLQNGLIRDFIGLYSTSSTTGDKESSLDPNCSFFMCTSALIL